MKYKIIFTAGYDDDIDSLTKQLRGDVLILDERGDYYNPQFVTIDRINSEFKDDSNSYLQDNLVILHKITMETILNSIADLDKWMFYKRWLPLSNDVLEKYFYPKSDWVYYSID